MEVRSKQVLGFSLGGFFKSFFLQLYPSTFLVQIKDLMVTLGPAVQACRKSCSFLGEASGSLTRIFPFGTTQRLLNCYYCGN